MQLAILEGGSLAPFDHTIMQKLFPRRTALRHYALITFLIVSLTFQGLSTPSSRQRSAANKQMRMILCVYRSTRLIESNGLMNRELLNALPLVLCTPCNFLSKMQTITIKRTLLDCHFYGWFLFIIGLLPCTLRNSDQSLIIRVF